MTDSFSFDDPEFFTVGTLGPRGERVFYIQSRGDGRLVSLRVEKQQVAQLANYLEQVLDDLPEADASPSLDDLTLREPVVAAWTVGAIGIAYSVEDDRLVILAEEMIEDEDNDPSQARFVLRRDQVLALIDRARDVVSAGRPPCEFCGRPLQPRDGGWCACSN